MHHEGSRDDAAVLLRRAAALATELGAEPVLREVTALAAAARIPLEPVEATPADAAGALPGLTKREREILTHIVAGRTYGEIARALFLSEKTVSSHVSNILRKTGMRQPDRPRAPGTARGQSWFAAVAVRALARGVPGRRSEPV